LDYSKPTNSKAVIAIVKLPAKVPSNSNEYRGPILFNPGGPGGSGVDSILNSGPQLQRIVGDEFDLIGFDPRGVGRTTPSVTAFEGDNDAGHFFFSYPININTSSDALGRAHAYSNILGDMVKNKSALVAQFVSTPMVARDMLSIVNALGHERLQYWGFSYGTVLGATFAAMFPDKIERLILDGVVDAENYYSGAWSNNVLDTDAALYDVYQQCAAAGPVLCPLYESTADGVKSRVDKILQSLKISPVPVFNRSVAGATSGVVDYEIAKISMLLMLYRTHSRGKALLDMFAALEDEDGWPMYSASEKFMFQQWMDCKCPALPDPDARTGRVLENLLAIACGDSTLEHETLDHLKGVYNRMAETSSFAETWWVHAMCSGWKVKSKERFIGSFNTTTSHPILFIGNTADPVTPLANAHKMASGFLDSVVLTQNASGHCSSSATSLCTTRAIRTYFQTGALPKSGTVCQVDSKIFGPSDITTESVYSEEDVALLEASRSLQDTYFVHALGGFGNR